MTITRCQDGEDSTILYNLGKAAVVDRIGKMGPARPDPTRLWRLNLAGVLLCQSVTPEPGWWARNLPDGTLDKDNEYIWIYMLHTWNSRLENYQQMPLDQFDTINSPETKGKDQAANK